MACLGVLMSAQLLPLVAAYQVGVNQDVLILKRLGHTSPGGDLGPVHALIAPWLDRVGFRFVRQLCPTLLLSYALEYGRVDLLCELVAIKTLCFARGHWTLRYGAWHRCASQHRHVKRHYTSDRNGNVRDFGGSCFYSKYGRDTISGSVRHFAVAACLGDHVDLLRFALENEAHMSPKTLVAIALRGGRLCIVQHLFEQGDIATFKAHHMRRAVASGSPDLVAFLLANSSGSMIAEAFQEAATQNQFALLQWLCTAYSEPVYWRIALDVAVADLQFDVIEYFATTLGFHLTPIGAARVQRRHQRDETADRKRKR
ncbi:hypothetical protein SDRG_17434, partial [Saprolegnia diclina VS20]